MQLMANLAYSQLKINKSRSVWTLLGVMLATAMITAVFGFVAAGDVMLKEFLGDNVHYIEMYNATLAAIGVIFASIIVVASVIVVSNSFRVSAGERFSQFGILKSVGATKKQISMSILFEGAILCLIGIPLGIGLGLLVNLVGAQIVNYFLEGLNRLNEGEPPLILHFVFSWQAVLSAIAVSLFTVLLSAWLPARKAAKVPAIEAIRGTGEITVKSKRLRANPLVKLLFGFEGTLASKSLKRSRRNFRATVVSLTVSVTMLVIIGYFGSLMQSTMNTFFPNVQATAAAQFTGRLLVTEDAEGNRKQETVMIDSVLASELAERMRGYQNTHVFGVGADGNTYEAEIPRDMMTSNMLAIFDSIEGYENAQEISLTVSLVVADEANYARLCELAGVPMGSNILVNRYTSYVEGGREVFAPYVFDNQVLHINGRYDAGSFDLPLHGVLTIDEIPGEITQVYSGSVTVIVPEAEVNMYVWFASPEDKEGFIEYTKNLFISTLASDYEVETSNIGSVLMTAPDSETEIYIMDVEAPLEVTQNTGRLIMVFIYGFVGMLTLIGLTNVISTISTNVRSRSKEFAVLRSVGMTPGGLGRMLNLESVLCSLKSLAYGVPLGILGSYLVFMGMEMPIESSFNIPWLPILYCVLGVFVITWVTMRYAASRLRNNSISAAITGIA